MLLYVGSFSNPLPVLGASVIPLNCCCFLARDQEQSLEAEIRIISSPLVSC